VPSTNKARFGYVPLTSTKSTQVRAYAERYFFVGIILRELYGRDGTGQIGLSSTTPHLMTSAPCMLDSIEYPNFV